MVRKTRSFVILGATLFWLVANYLPERYISLPQFSFAPLIGTQALKVIAVSLLLIFVCIQLTLVWASHRMFASRRPNSKRLNQMQEMGLHRHKEVLWSTVPVVATLLLIGVIVYTHL